ncbi:G-type lectin S-receptor-like serine/threonine-protein kinase At1g11300 [Quercus lobata]|uniref:G-type lectin S-receptor-like serine/threonine-protein kinase At1g11300 n=1 Tax=Quercus lobata TaxID=97700 RepID=UPI001243BD74|nr:G-type lectin S-receptor-like serine/threonine-protein kinase At1g11300 [Quercus lobata]
MLKRVWWSLLLPSKSPWVLRNDPINDSAGVLSINQFGNLVLHDSFNCLLWSANVSVQVTASSVAQLQDSRNLVLIQGNNKKWTGKQFF